MAKKQTQTDNLQELKAAIRSKNPARVYIFHGEETFLLNHYLQQLKKILVDELTESFNFHKLNNESFSVQTLLDCVEAFPMMAERSMVWVDEVELFKLPESERNKVGEVLCDMPDYCTLVFTYVATPWKPDKRLKSFWEAVSGSSVIVEFAKQDQSALIPWISRHFAAQSKQISNELCRYLIDITGGTMTGLSGEINKLCAYSGADHITKSDIDAVVEPVLDAVVFQMTDLLGQGHYGPALLKLQQLMKMQQEPIAVLGAIGGHFRSISTARSLRDMGKNVQDLMAITGMKEYPAKKAMNAAARFGGRFCARAAELILETDRKMKTSYDDPQRLLEMLVLALAQEARNG